ncbi:MAG TPA: hypothetical protein VKF32_02590 [Thermoanaerobaculia bacterium]|nr:hypothetical protein [Thermoanaerobaculia bacterium]
MHEEVPALPRRFEEVARRVAASGREMTSTPLEELDRIWDAVKAEESDAQ